MKKMLFLAVMSTACGSDSDFVEDENVSMEEAELGGRLSSLPAQGGGGGSEFGEHDRGIVYGFRVRSGTRVDQVEMAFYIPSNSDNAFRSGDFVGTIGPFGGNGGQESGWRLCPPGSAAVGLQGRDGSRIDRLGLICGEVSNTANISTTAQFGGNGGNAFFVTCEAGGFLSGISGRSATEVDRLQGLCRAQN